MVNLILPVISTKGNNFQQAVFCLNLSGTQIQGKIISEAARVAQRAFLHKSSTSSDAAARSRAFWVVYYIEKTVTFHHGTTSVILMISLIDVADMYNSLSWTVTLARPYPLFVRQFSANSTGSLLQYGLQDYIRAYLPTCSP